MVSATRSRTAVNLEMAPNPEAPVGGGASAALGKAGKKGSGGKLAIPRYGRRGAGQGFAVKLFDLLATAPPDVVSWTNSGLAFKVKDDDRFANEVLTKYYKHNKFSSFQRQLNLYGFRKVIKGPEQGCYMHPCFQRDQPELMTEVRRSLVPTYEVHGLNEIHGQHHHHHPPQANQPKVKSEPARAMNMVYRKDAPKSKAAPAANGNGAPANGAGRAKGAQQVASPTRVHAPLPLRGGLPPNNEGENSKGASDRGSEEPPPPPPPPLRAPKQEPEEEERRQSFTQEVDSFDGGLGLSSDQGGSSGGVPRMPDPVQRADTYQMWLETVKDDMPTDSQGYPLNQSLSQSADGLYRLPSLQYAHDGRVYRVDPPYPTGMGGYNGCPPSHHPEAFAAMGPPTMPMSSLDYPQPHQNVKAYGVGGGMTPQQFYQAVPQAAPQAAPHSFQGALPQPQHAVSGGQGTPSPFFRDLAVLQGRPHTLMPGEQIQQQQQPPNAAQSFPPGGVSPTDESGYDGRNAVSAAGAHQEGTRISPNGNAHPSQGQEDMLSRSVPVDVPDPSMPDIMDVLAQCLEILSSMSESGSHNPSLSGFSKASGSGESKGLTGDASNLTNKTSISQLLSMSYDSSKASSNLSKMSNMSEINDGSIPAKNLKPEDLKDDPLDSEEEADGKGGLKHKVKQKVQHMWPFSHHHHHDANGSGSPHTSDSQHTEHAHGTKRAFSRGSGNSSGDSNGPPPRHIMRTDYGSVTEHAPVPEGAVRLTPAYESHSSLADVSGQMQSARSMEANSMGPPHPILPGGGLSSGSWGASQQYGGHMSGDQAFDPRRRGSSASEDSRMWFQAFRDSSGPLLSGPSYEAMDRVMNDETKRSAWDRVVRGNGNDDTYHVAQNIAQYLPW